MPETEQPTPPPPQSPESSELAELLKHYKPGKPFPGGTMRVGRTTAARPPLVAKDEKDRDLGL